jgi:hypothetical protein
MHGTNAGAGAEAEAGLSRRPGMVLVLMLISRQGWGAGASDFEQAVDEERQQSVQGWGAVTYMKMAKTISGLRLSSDSVPSYSDYRPRKEGADTQT